LGSRVTLPGKLPVDCEIISVEVVYQITAFIASTAVPELRRFLIDNDKVAGACSNIVYYIVSPGIKIKAR
jgi:hypothetical protein